MGFTEVLTIVFVVLKLIGVIDWNWFLVLLPEIIAIAIYALLFVFAFVVAVFSAKKEIERKRSTGFRVLK